MLMTGVNRSLTFTLPSIDREIINPLRRSKNMELETFAYFIVPRDHHIHNPRTGEIGFIGKSFPAALSQWSHVEESVGDDTDNPGEMAIFSGAPWHYDSTTVRNLYIYLSTLEQCFDKFVAKQQFDALVICRPDILVFPGLEILRKIRLLSWLSMLFHRVAIVPSWHQWGGVNDRFAILSHRAAREYLTRIRLVLELPKNNGLINSEMLLKLALEKTLTLPWISTPMLRVRMGNRLHQSDIDCFFGT